MLGITLMKDVVCDSQFEHLVGYCISAAARQTADVGSASGWERDSGNPSEEKNTGGPFQSQKTPENAAKAAGSVEDAWAANWLKI